MTRKRLTPVELSLVLGEHDAGNLIRFGILNWNLDGRVGWMPTVCGCINQARFNDPSKQNAYIQDPSAAFWFDRAYLRYWTPDEFLAAMEAAGL